MKVTDLFISAIMRKGLIYEAKSCDMEFDIPIKQSGVLGQEDQDGMIKVRFKADNMTIKIDKD